MRLLASGFSTAETSVVSRSAGDQGSGTGQGRSLKVRKVVVMAGGSTVGANTSGVATFQWGASSVAVEGTLKFPTPIGGDVSSKQLAAAQQWEVDGLALDCDWLEFKTNETNAGGVAVFALGD